MRATPGDTAGATLIEPTAAFRPSLADAWDEFAAAGEDAENNSGLWGFERGAVADEARFAAALAALTLRADPASPRPAGRVPDTTLWWVAGDRWLGRVSIRHRLNDNLVKVGGHIGYAVRPSARRLGHATALLAATLPVARALGIDPALVTCNATNVASRKVIERAGGVLEDERAGTLRFWLATSAPQERFGVTDDGDPED